MADDSCTPHIDYFKTKMNLLGKNLKQTRHDKNAKRYLHVNTTTWLVELVMTAGCTVYPGRGKTYCLVVDLLFFWTIGIVIHN